MVEHDLNMLDYRLGLLEKRMVNVGEALWGNGKEGLINSFTRQESRQEEILRRLESIDRKLDQSSAFERITIEHIKDEDKHSLWDMLASLGPKKIALIIFLSIVWQVVTHSLIPAGVDIWELVLKALTGL